MKNFKGYLLLYAKGVGIGGANVVPGVSGGTMALLMGIYEELLLSLNSIDREAAQLLSKFRLLEFWKKINGSFLLVLIAGIGTGFATLAKLMTYLFAHHPIMVWSFYFGLISISSPLVLRTVEVWSITPIITFIIGCLLGYTITILSPYQTPNGLWFVFIAGVITTPAMLLPGNSWAFILLLLGKYQFITNAFFTFDISIIVIFILGCTLGLFTFSRFLTWILKNYRDATVALLTGFMVGSLNKIWPWRYVLEWATNSKGEQVPVLDTSIWPWDYLQTMGKDPQVFQAIIMMALGVFIVVLIEKIAERLKTKI